MAKCAISDVDIKPGDAIVETSRFNHPGPSKPVLVAALKQAFHNTTVIEEMRRRIQFMEEQLGIDSKVNATPLLRGARGG